MMAEKTDRSDEVIEFALDRTEKNGNLVQNDLPGNMVTNTAPGRTLQKLSPILELDPGSDAASTGSSDGISSSTTSLPDTQDAEVTMPDSFHRSAITLTPSPDACAGIILNCLFCQFYDLCLTLPDTCKRAAYQICPACSYLFAPLEPVQSSDWNCHCDIDCDLFDACQETSNCLELAMEISEICYR